METEVFALIQNLTNPDNKVQSDLYKTVEQWSKSNEFSIILSKFLLLQQINNDNKIRVTTLLKVQVDLRYAYYTPEELQFLKASLLTAYKSESALMSSVSNIISTIIERGGICQWPELIMLLQNEIANPSNLIESHIETLYKIIEDSPFEIVNNTKIDIEKLFYSVLNAASKMSMAGQSKILLILTIIIINIDDQALHYILQEQLLDYIIKLIQSPYPQFIGTLFKTLNYLCSTQSDWIFSHLNDIIKIVSENLNEKNCVVAQCASEFLIEYIIYSDEKRLAQFADYIPL